MFPLPSQRVLRVLLPFVSFSLALWLTISYINPSSPSFAPSSPFTSRAIPFHAHPQSQLQSRQAPNTWYSKDPLGQTASYNFTAFVLPLKKEVAAGLVGGTERDLLPLPVKELGLEGVVGEGEHALVCMSGLLFDIRQAVLSIERLQSANCYLPYYDATHDGRTPYTFDVINLQDKLIPVLAGSLQQSIKLLPANFEPRNDAYRAIGAQARGVDVSIGAQGSNALGLPVPNVPVMSLLWAGDKADKDVSKFVQGALTAPYVHTYSRLCSRTFWKFDEVFADAENVRGDVQLFPPATASHMESKGVAGYKATAAWDNQFGPGQTCASLRSEAAAVRYH